MLYRLNIIFMFFCSIAFSQVQFSRIVPIDYYHGDGKSMGMGNSMVSNCSSSLAIISNPAKLASLRNSFYFQSFLSSISERRSTIISDMWGDFLANADYVFNQNSNLKASAGFNYSKSYGDINFGVGLSIMPYSSFNYTYEEEVRSDADLEDGVIGIDDPIIGFHILRNKGDVYVNSIGFACSFKKRISIGVGFNQIQSSMIKDDISIDIVDATEYSQNNLSSIQNYENSLSIEKKGFITFSINYLINDLDISLSIENDAMIGSKDESSFQISEQLGLPIIFDSENSFLNYNISGLSYQKPSKISFGLMYTPKYNSDFSISLVTVQKKWNHNINYSSFLIDSIVEYRFGFEYAPIKGFPIRAGLVYSESPFLILDPKTVLTLGTGKKFGDVTLDLALNYNKLSYLHYDLFPTEDIFDLNCDEIGCDTVKENSLIFLATVRYNF